MGQELLLVEVTVGVAVEIWSRHALRYFSDGTEFVLGFVQFGLAGVTLHVLAANVLVLVLLQH